jgi:hypothetical protein
MPFTFTVEHEDGSPAEPPTLSSAVPNWRPAIPVSFPIFRDDGSIAFIGLREPDGAQQTRQICRVTYAAHSSQPFASSPQVPRESADR